MMPKLPNCVWLIALLAVLFACSQKKAVIGYWQLGDAQSFCEFKEDGVCMSHGQLASKVAGRYTLLSRDKLKIEITGTPQPKMLSVSIKGDTMTITENNMTLNLHRVDASCVKPEATDEEQIRNDLEQRIGTATNPSLR